jgi:hypothetical protein
VCAVHIDWLNKESRNNESLEAVHIGPRAKGGVVDATDLHDSTEKPDRHAFESIRFGHLPR